jgi:hypothetical protein
VINVGDIAVDSGNCIWPSSWWVFLIDPVGSLPRRKLKKMLFSLLFLFFGIKSDVFMSNIMSVFKLCVNILLEAAKIEFYRPSSALISKSSL